MLELQHISKSYGAVKALQDVSFTVPKGQILGLLGENGAGKSTALNIITGCLAPDMGTVKINGADIVREHKKAKRNIGYLPENAPLYEEMTVKEFLRFVCRLREVKEKEIPDHIDEICLQTGLSQLKDRVIGHLSKGLKQRTALAQALCGLPEMIVLDEPTVGLDPLQNNEFRQMLLELKGKHSVIFSSHILSEVQAISDRVLILHQGKLIFDSNDTLPPDQVRLRLCAAIGTDRLLPKLRMLQGLISAEAVPGGTPGLSEVLLTAERDAQIERKLFSLLVSLNAPILRLQPEETTLENVFIMKTGSAGSIKTPSEENQ